MHLARQHALTSHPPAPAFLHAAFYTAAASTPTPTTPDLFACATQTGFFVAHTSPLLELTRTQFSSSQGGLALVLPVEHTSLLLLVGGGRVPRFAPNKLILWDDAAAAATRPSEHSTAGNYPRPPHQRARSSSTASSSSSLDPSSSDVGSIRDEDDDPAQGHDNDDDDQASPASSFSDASSSSSNSREERSMYVSAVYGSASGVNRGNASTVQPTSRKQTQNASPKVRQPERIIPKEKEKAKEKQREGAAVAELEFAEGVTGVQIHPFDMPSPPLTSQPSNWPNDAQQQTVRRCYIVVVVLKTKAIIFELAPNGQSGPSADSTSRKDTPGLTDLSKGWAITHRTTVEVAGKARQGLAAIAPALPPPNYHKRPRRGTTAALIALPGRQKGHVQLVRVPLLYGSVSSNKPTPEQADPSQLKLIGPSTIIIAHSSELNSLTLSPCGRLLITSSDRGTLIRLWSVSGEPVAFGSHRKQSLDSTMSPSHSSKASGASGLQPTLIRELRRGTDQAYILSVSVAPDLSALAVASDKGTVHIFRLSAEAPKGKSDGCSEQGVSESEMERSPPVKSSSSFPIPKAFKKATSLTRKHLLPTATSSLSILPGSKQLKKYLGSEWSNAHFRIPLRTFGGRSAEGTWGERGGPGGVESPHVRVVMRKADSVQDSSKGKGKQKENSAAAEAELEARGTAADRWASMGPTVERLGSAADGFPQDEYGGSGGSGAGAWVLDGIDDDEEDSPALSQSASRTKESGLPASNHNEPPKLDPVRRGPIEAITGGSARSTEGGWAAMRARLEDVRRGEAGLDEKIFLTWTRARSSSSSSSSSSSPSNPSSTAPVPSQPTASSSGSTPTSASRSAVTTPSQTPSYELIALTTGGGWYRIGLSNPSDRSSSNNSNNNKKDGADSETHTPRASFDARRHTRGDQADDSSTIPSSADDDDGADGDGDGGGARRRAEDRELEKSGMIQGCVLLEYRRFGQRDEWEGDPGAGTAEGV
ncbi:unnamed protein product [Tilletia controversa]|nr:unnamed protein product [Tilletia controversa]